MLHLTNRHQDQPLDVVFESKGTRFAGEFRPFVVTASDIKAENTFNASPVKTVGGKAISAGRGTLKYTCPPRSFTMLRGGRA